MNTPEPIVMTPKLKMLNSNQRLNRFREAEQIADWKLLGKIAARGHDPIPTPVRIIVHFWKPATVRYDPNNLWPTVKAITDGFVAAGLLSDDDHKHVIGPDMRHGGIGPQRIQFTFEPLETP